MRLASRFAKMENFMQQNNGCTPSSSNGDSGEFGLHDIGNFFAENWKVLVGMTAIGAFAAGGFLVLASREYQASMLIEGAEVGGSKIVEPIGNLIERLKFPTTFTPETLRSCALSGEPSGTESLADMVRATVVNNSTSLFTISVRRNSPEVARQCAASLFELIRKNQQELVKRQEAITRAELEKLRIRLRDNQDFIRRMDKVGLYRAVYFAKRDESIYLLERVNQFERSLALNTPTHLAAPIHVSLKPVYPKPVSIMSIGVLTGLFIGLVLAAGRKVLRGSRKY